MLTNNYRQLLQQILIWTIGWTVILFFLTNGIESPYRFFRRILPTIIGMAVIIWVNYNLLLPRLYFQKKIGLFVISGLPLILGIFFLIHSDLMPWAEWLSPKKGPFSNLNNRGGEGGRKMLQTARFGIWMSRMMPFFIAFLGSSLIEVSRYANKKEKEVIESERAKLVTELKFLKSQINPHFLFNTLNNIYTLTVIKSDKAPENLLRLSEMLRYMLYDTDSGKVPLKKEIAYLKNYVNLMGLKDSRGLNVTLEVEESHSNLMVAPLLFIPFVENAYKHSKIEDLQKGFIKIRLKTEGHHLEFSVENSVPINNFTKDKVGGIGLQNIRQRLELIYPNMYQLEIKEKEELFSVLLKINTPKN